MIKKNRKIWPPTPWKIIALLALLMVLLLPACQKNAEDFDLSSAYLPLPPGFILRIVTHDSTGWRPLFPNVNGQGVIAGYDVDSVALYDDAGHSLIHERYSGADNWYFPSIHYTINEKWGLEDTVDRAQHLSLRMNATSVEDLTVHYRFGYDPNRKQKFWLDYARFYQSDSLLVESHDLTSYVYVAI